MVCLSETYLDIENDVKARFDEKWANGSVAEGGEGHGKLGRVV